MDEYDVSRVTCRQAFALLAQNGYIQRFRGIGTVVAYEKISEEMNQVISLTEEMKKHNIVMHTTFCQMDLISPDTRVAVTLGILKTDQCYRLVRVRDVDGKPLVYTVTYLKKIVDPEERIHLKRHCRTKRSRKCFRSAAVLLFLSEREKRILRTMKFSSIRFAITLGTAINIQ